MKILDKRLTRGGISSFRAESPHIPITKYKAKADEKMRFTKQNIERAFDKFMQGGNDSFADLKERIINLVDEPEKVVVPKFVAEWYKSQLGYNIYRMIENLFNGSDLEEIVLIWLRGNYSKYGLRDRFDLLALMRVYGYTIEPEQLYYIPLLDLVTSDGKQQVLSKRENDENYFASRPTEALQQRYTKEELERVPEVYKPFAKPSEEEE